jgi:hypothetical protein
MIDLEQARYRKHLPLIVFALAIVFNASGVDLLSTGNVFEYGAIVVLASWRLTRIPEFFVPDSVIERRRDRLSRRPRLERFLGVSCEAVNEGIYALHKCGLPARQ